MGKVQRLSHQQIKAAIKRDEFRDFLGQSLDWTRSHLENVIIGSVLLAVLTFGLYYYLNGRSDSSLKASMQLATADSQFQHALSSGTDVQSLAAASSAYQGVKTEFEGQAESLLAELGLANVDFQGNKFDEARQAYERFASQHASSPLAAVALAGQAASLEGLGKMQEASDLYLSIQQKYPLSPDAALGLMEAARIVESLNQKARLKDIVAALEKLDSEKRLPESLQGRLAALKARQG